MAPLGVGKGNDAGDRTMNGEKLQVHPECLMVFVDETGHEEFADPNYPAFGFGGCAVPAFAANDVLEQAWREMKQCHFGGADVALHASGLRNPTPEHLQSLKAFFRDNRFGAVRGHDVPGRGSSRGPIIHRGHAQSTEGQMERAGVPRSADASGGCLSLRGVGARKPTYREILWPNNCACGGATHSYTQRFRREVIWAGRT